MRRSLAPSQILKRKTPWVDDESDNDKECKLKRDKLKKVAPEDTSKFSQHLSRQPFTSLCMNGSLQMTEHEARIKKILAKPFKVPIPNYQGWIVCIL